MKEAGGTDENGQQNGLKPVQKEHWWLNPQLIGHLPVTIKKGKDSGSKVALSCRRRRWKVNVIKLSVDVCVSVV